MNWKNNRAWSFVVVTVIYAIAIALGVVLAIILPFDLWLSILIADVASTIFVFAFSVLLNNASVYDPYWSVQPMVIGVALLVYTQNYSLFNILLLSVVLLWGIRLTANWAYTFYNFTYQDWRYIMLKEKTKKAYPIINFVGIHAVPTLVVYGCVLPIIIVMQHTITLSLDNVTCLIGLALSLGAVALQCASDVQMHKFRKDKREGKTAESFMRRGLWKYSRHPNYLAEILMWWGVGLAVISVLDGIEYLPLLIGALANTCLFMFVSIPMADGRQSRKQGFEQYKKETFMLLPINKNLFRKSKSENTAEQN